MPAALGPMLLPCLGWAALRRESSALAEELLQLCVLLASPMPAASGPAAIILWITDLCHLEIPHSPSRSPGPGPHSALRL